jgi:thioester reductase-like protein
MGPAQLSSVPELPISANPSVALSTGYAQSKFIIERILQTAASPRSLNIPITILRVGQLCGDTKTGAWNTNEMFPILFATSVHLHAIPVFPKKSVDWIPVDIAAASVSEVLTSSRSNNEIGSEWGDYSVHNIVNPSSISWSELVEMLQQSSLARRASLEEVDMQEWVRRLKALADKGSDSEVVGLRLLGFFENMIGDDGESKIFETDKSRDLSKSLRNCKAFCPEWIEANLKVWRKDGFIDV